MKLVCCVFVFWFACGYSWGDLDKYGPFQLALKSGLIKCNHDRTLALDVSAVDVYFYDFSNNDVETFAMDEAPKGILSINKLDKKRKFIVYVGGYKSHIKKRNEEQMRDTFRTVPNSYLIILDHSTYTNDRQGSRKSYARSVKYVHYIGKALGRMLAELYIGGVPAKNIHCIGHSLGAQMIGQAGEEFLRVTGQKIARISALDPAGPCFSNSFIENQVRSTLAEFVDIYHCNAGGLGSSSVLGNVDFFVNKKGQTQPDCGTRLIPGSFDTKGASCNHRVCVDLWTASVRHPDWFLAYKCDSYTYFKNGKCSENDNTIAGYWNPGNTTGVFYLSTEGYDLKL